MIDVIIYNLEKRQKVKQFNKHTYIYINLLKHYNSMLFIFCILILQVVFYIVSLNYSLLIKLKKEVKKYEYIQMVSVLWNRIVYSFLVLLRNIYFHYFM